MPKQGQQKGTPARRAEFIESLRSVGPGPDCVYWPWSDKRDDYARIFVNGCKVPAHRWVYEQFYGVASDRSGRRGAVGDDLVLHHCDNPPCVRPDHLFLGSQADNVRDASRKGRMYGGRIGDMRTKLSDQDVEMVRRLASEGVRQSKIARSFGVSDSLVSLIVHRRKRVSSGA